MWENWPRHRLTTNTDLQNVRTSRAEFFPSVPKNQHSRARARWVKHELRPDSLQSSASPLGPVLATVSEERLVFRLTVLFIVSTLAAGPSAGLLCKTSCHPQNVAASACHHEDTGATVASEESCNDAVLTAAPFLPEQVLRG